jgi:hypothetical protein
MARQQAGTRWNFEHSFTGGARCAKEPLAFRDWKNARAVSTLDPARKKPRKAPFNRFSERPFFRNPSDFPGARNKIRAPTFPLIIRKSLNVNVLRFDSIPRVIPLGSPISRPSKFSGCPAISLAGKRGTWIPKQNRKDKP